MVIGQEKRNQGDFSIAIGNEAGPANQACKQYNIKCEWFCCKQLSRLSNTCYRQTYQTLQLVPALSNTNPTTGEITYDTLASGGGGTTSWGDITDKTGNNGPGQISLG